MMPVDNLHHQPVAGAEGVIDVGHGKTHFGHLAWLKWLRAGEAVAELAAEWFATNQHLVVAHLHTGRVGIVIGVIRRKNIHHLHHPVGIGAGGADKQIHGDRAHHRQVLR